MVVKYRGMLVYWYTRVLKSPSVTTALPTAPYLGSFGQKPPYFKNSEKVPLDILEIHVVSKFGPIRIKIAAGSLSEPHTYIHTDGRTFQYPGIPIY